MRGIHVQANPLQKPRNRYRVTLVRESVPGEVAFVGFAQHDEAQWPVHAKKQA